MRAGVVLQARMGSTRLPGKVLEYVGRWSMLEHCVRRLRAGDCPVIVATTTAPADAAIEEAARAMGAHVFRGDETNVLSRYREAARAFALTHVVRATADNPFVDGEGVRRTLHFLERVGADHVVECGLPVGAAVEAVTVDALDRALSLVSDPYDREHVTSFIRRDGRFRALRAVAPGAIRRPGLRLTVDTADDLEFVRHVHSDLGSPDTMAPLTAVIAAADARIVRGMAQKRISQGA
ncbi:MAG: NTP transferase domain-containing protein [Acidobacteria bacterium]|nr:NTP transferase domain-containing protein [Acidobacteriota bacterium]